MPQIKFAIFDVGQTIYPYTLEPLNNLMRQLTRNITTFDNKHTALDYDYKPYMKGQLNNREFGEDLCRFCNVIYSNKIHSQIIEALFKGRGEPFKETLDAINRFKSCGIEVGILSNALPALGDAQTDLAKPEYIFPSYELGLLKPDIKIYQTMAKKLNVPYEEILFIDDKERNIIPARDLGINGIIFNPKTILTEIRDYLPKEINNV